MTSQGICKGPGGEHNKLPQAGKIVISIRDKDKPVSAIWCKGCMLLALR